MVLGVGMETNLNYLFLNFRVLFTNEVIHTMWKFKSSSTLQHHFSDIENTHDKLIINEEITGINIDHINSNSIAIIAPKASTQDINRILDQLLIEKKIQSIYIDWEDDLFPQSLLQFKKLKHLGLVNHKLKTIPNTIDELKKLQTLLLHCTYLIGLPKAIAKLQKLETLDLMLHQVESLPKQYSVLLRLKTFILSIKSFSVHKDWQYDYEYPTKWKQDNEALFNIITQFEQLEQLSLSEERHLNEWCGHPDIKQLGELPPTIEKLPLLSILELNNDYNKPTLFPIEILRLKKLKEIRFLNSLSEKHIKHLLQLFPNSQNPLDTEQYPKVFKITH